MIGVLVNTIAIIIGSGIGLIFKKGIPEKFSAAVLTGINLCVLCIGISGTLKGENTLIAIISMVLGALAGTWLDIDGFFNRLGISVEKKLSSGSNNSGIAEGFVTASLIFAVGSMAIVGSINAGISGDNEMLFTKSLLDFVTSIMLTVSLGIGVMLSCVVIFIYQGAIVLLSSLIAPVLNESAINEMTCVGSILIMVLGLNMLKITKIKVADYLPALIFAPVLALILSNCRIYKRRHIRRQ